MNPSNPNRKKICAGNWKMYKSPAESVQYFREWPSASVQLRCDVVIFAPAYNLPAVADGTGELQKITMSKNFSFGSQNHHFAAEGAYTGENSPDVVRKIGAAYALVGHSERRTLFGETDEATTKKVKAAADTGLTPMLCVGETLSEREKDETENVVSRQLHAGLAQLPAPSAGGRGHDVVIAYEPVWAIGTGKVATPEQAEEAHAFIRKELGKILGEGRAAATPILYGGSVKPDNAEGLAKKPNIDGFLVGGASLKPADFAKIAAAL